MGLFLPHLFGFFGLFFDKMLLIETVLLARFFHLSLSSILSLEISSLPAQGVNWQVKMILRCFLLQHFSWQHYIKSTALMENEGEVSAEQCLGREEREDYELQRCFK